MDKTPCDTKSLCRTCMSDAPQLMSLYDNINPRMKIVDALVFVTDMVVSKDDLLPKQVCLDCQTLVKKFEEFKRRCFESEATFYAVIRKDQSSAVNSSDTLSCEVLTKVEKAEDQVFGSNGFDGPAEELSVNLDSKDINLGSEIKKEIDDHDYDCSFENTEVFSDIICVLCDKKFKTTSEKHQHDADCHKEFGKAERRNSEDMALTELTSAGKLKKCNICIKWFPSKKFSAHIRRKHKVSAEEKYECSECLRKFVRKETLSAHMKRHQNPTAYCCDICKRAFKHKAHLNNHIVTAHTTEKSLKCLECSETFDSAESLELHLSTHQHKKKHKCEFCSKSFHMLSTLKDHVRVHTGEKPYLCPTCGKGFSQNTNLIEHIRRHQGIKPFKCENCPKAFVSKGELSAHRRTHTGAHPFVCDGVGGCNARFTTASSLAKHRRAHSGERPYACDLCAMRFAASGTLKNHRRTHTGERPHQCAQCARAFVQRHDLVAHARRHSGERPFVCAVCGQPFRQGSALKAHLRVHAKGGGSAASAAT